MKIMYIDIDTLRPDHMGCYGYARNTTPNIDKIANQGMKFTNYYCSDAPCLPSRASLITSMFGIHHGAVGHGGTAADKRLFGEARDFRDSNDQNNFNNVFRKAGYYTSSISTFPERHSSWWYNSGFNEMHNVGDGGMESGEKVLPVALDWLERNKDRDNWYLHVHLWDPHSPYRAPADFGNPFEGEPLEDVASWITEDVLAEHLKHVGPHSLNELNMYDDGESPRYPRHPGKAVDMAGIKRIFDGYDCGIRYADYLVGQIFNFLRNNNIFDDTAIIISSDHGENMGELGIYIEHATADHGTCNIPMIIKFPNGAVGTDDELHYNIDLAPTMAELLGVKPYPKWDGESYAKTIQNGDKCGREYLVISQMAHVCQRSVRYKDWLYMRTYHDGLHLFDKEMLFNLKDDLHEQNDVKEQYPEIVNQCAKMLFDWHDNMMTTSDYTIDPLWTVMSEGGPLHARGHLESYTERLKKTGREEGAEILLERRKNKKNFLF